MRAQYVLGVLGRAALYFSAAGLLSLGARGQDSRQAAAKEQPSSESKDEIRKLSDSIGQLKTLLESMNGQLAEMRQEQTRSREETRELRRQLEAAQRKLNEQASAAPAAGSYPPANYQTGPAAGKAGTVSAPTMEHQETESAATTEENQQLLEAKINEQYQTKVESGSKYKLRLSGIMLLNLYANRRAVDNQDFPQMATGMDAGVPRGTFGGSLRQSQVGLEAFGPEIGGARTRADLRFDFAGGLPGSPYGTSTGLVRLRTGTLSLDWKNTSVVAGQDFLFFAPLAPTSLASLAIPALAYNGNLWSWTPQVRVEHRVAVREGSTLIVQGGILDSLSGEPPKGEYDRLPTNGEASGQPAYAARVAWQQETFGQKWTLGFGGYYGRQNWAFGRKIDGWAGTTDLTLPLGKMFEFTGEFYRGRAVGGIGGGIGQSVLLSGAATDPATVIRGLDSMGGWAQLKFRPKPKWEFNGAFGQDNPFASELRLFPLAGNYADSLARNRSAFVNMIYSLKSNVLFAAEYRRLRTDETASDSYTANHINFSVGYIF